MRYFKSNMPMMQKKEDDPAPGGAPTPEPGKEQTPPTNPPPAKGEGDDDEYDELGYKKEKTGTPPKTGDNPPNKEESEPKEDEPVKEPASGYTAEPEVVKEDDPPTKPIEGDPPPAPDEIDKALEGVHKDDLVGIKATAKDLGLNAEQAKKLAAAAVAERARVEKWRTDQQKDIEKKVKLRNQTWFKELKEDKDFGGEKFAKNTQMAEKLLQDYGPEFKKQLTESKGMLPPNVMRMLARAAAIVYQTDKMIQGDPTRPAPNGGKPKDTTDEALEFYG